MATSRRSPRSYKDLDDNNDAASNVFEGLKQVHELTSGLPKTTKGIKIRLLTRGRKVVKQADKVLGQLDDSHWTVNKRDHDIERDVAFDIVVHIAKKTLGDFQYAIRRIRESRARRIRVQVVRPSQTADGKLKFRISKT